MENNQLGRDKATSNPLKVDLVSRVCGGADRSCTDAQVKEILQAQNELQQAVNENAEAVARAAAVYGAPAIAVAALGSQALVAAALAGGLDYVGSTYSYKTGLSKDAPNFTNSFIAGAVAGLIYPFAISDTAIAGMNIAGKIATNAYNAGVAGAGSYGTAGMTGVIRIYLVDSALEWLHRVVW